MRRLIGIGYSPWTLGARWALRHHRLEHVYEEYVPFLGEPIVRARLGFPRGKLTVPILVDGRELLRDSAEIARHADRTGGGPSLFPASKHDELARWLPRIDELARSARAVVTPRMARDPRVLVEIQPSWIPGPLRSMSVPLTRVAVGYVGGKHDVREEDEARHLRVMRDVLSESRARLAGGRYLLGELTYADVALTCAMQGVRPSFTLAPSLKRSLGSVWENQALASEFADLLAWRDRTVAEHAPA